MAMVMVVEVVVVIPFPIISFCRRPTVPNIWTRSDTVT